MEEGNGGKSDHVTELAALVAEVGLREGGAGPAAGEFEGVEGPFGDAATSADGAALVDAVGGERDDAGDGIGAYGDGEQHVGFIGSGGRSVEDAEQDEGDFLAGRQQLAEGFAGFGQLELGAIALFAEGDEAEL